MNERGFYHVDLGLIADPQRKISLKSRKLPAGHHDDESVYVAMDLEAKPIPRFAVVSRERPLELVCFELRHTLPKWAYFRLRGPPRRAEAPS